MQIILFDSFKERFTSNVQNGRTLNLDFLPQLVSSQEAKSVVAPFSDEEIIASFFSMNPLKVPGSDGFGPKFYQTYWPIIGKEVSTTVKSFFFHGKIPAAPNHTIIVVLPKIENPESPNHFKPISLCNTIYKEISKLLVSRLSPILQHHISPSQNAFILERSIHDNFLLVQEILMFSKNQE